MKYHFSWFFVFFKLLFVYTQQPPSTLSLIIIGKGPKCVYIYICVCVCVLYKLQLFVYLPKHIFANRFMIRCGWFLDFIEYFELYAILHELVQMHYFSIFKKALFISKLLYITFCVYNWKKKRVLCIVLKTEMVKQPKKKVPVPGFFTSFGGFDLTKL